MKSAISFLICFAFFLQSEASEKIQIQTMQTVADKVAELRTKYSAQDILVVFDIDNTLLTTSTDIGGDAWFSWQEEKLKNNDPQDRVANTFEGLLEIQGLLYAIGQMNPPEKLTPTLFRALQAQAIPVMMLTARGPGYSDYTQRELERNGYYADLSAPGPQGGFPGRFLPYDPTRPEQACITPQEVTAWGLSTPRYASYNEGVYYSEGQHKGAMLRSLLCRLHKNYAAIVFVDDSEKHVDRVLKAYENSGTEVLSMRYGVMDSQVQRFKNSDKREVITAWTKLKEVLESVFGRKF